MSSRPGTTSGPSNFQANRRDASGLVSYANRSAEPAAHKPLESGKLIAVVGDAHVLAGDMAHFIDPIIEENRDRLRSSSDEEKLRLQLTRQILKQYIEIKAMYQEFFRDLVGTAPPEEIAEMKKQVVTRAARIFFEKQVPNLLKQHKAVDYRDLQEKLAAKSLSLVTMRSQFIEQVLSQEFERKYVPADFEVTREELLDYYREHRSEWNVLPKARWRQLTIRFDKHDGNRALVEATIKELGNQVYLGGKPFDAVARESSEGYTASEGGVYDWTRQGSLKSKPIDAAIFNIPLKKLSRVITDDIGMHIIEVLEREEGFTKEFTEAQAEIREILSKQKRDEATKKLRAKVLARTPIWSRWPEDLKSKVPHVRPLSEAIGDSD